MATHIQVMTTASSREDAQRIAGALVDRRLAACVQVIGPIASTYRWEGKVTTDEEWLCLAKSRDDLYPALERAILELHPYEVPEILAVPVLAGGAAYLAWLDREVGGQRGNG
jgi:periplasmic divalent cation tolerance protein